MLRPFAALCLTLAATTALAAQRTPIDTAAIRAYVQQEIRSDGLPGLAIAIVSRDAIEYAEGFGTTGRDGEPITPDTPFILGSMSKSVTALAVMQLVGSGQVELDAPVSRYLADFTLADGAGAQITVRHLLAHTSGIPTSAPRARGDARTLADHVRALREVTPEHAPGAVHEYSSPNYQVLGRLIEVVSGVPFDQYVTQHVFRPLGMHHSFADEASARAAGLARGHQMVFGIAMPRDLPFESDRLPAASLVSSANDLARFLRAQLTGGEKKLDGVRVLTASATQTMHTSQVQSEGFGYAMGWRVSVMAGDTAVHHGGILPNYRGKMVMLPARGLAVVVLTNVSSVIGAPTSHRIADGVAAFLAGGQLPKPSGRLRWTLLAVTLGMLIVLALQLRGLVRSGRAPGTRRGAAMELAMAAAVLMIPSLAFGFGWGEMLRQMPDVGGWMLVSAAIGIATGLLRSARSSLPLPTSDSASPTRSEREPRQP